MIKIYSVYKIFGGFGLLLGLNFLIGLGVYKGLIDGQEIKLFDTSTWLHNENYKMVIFLLGVQLLFIVLFMTQCQFVIISKERITFINPLLPFIRKHHRWDTFDNYFTVGEYARGGPHEAVWLIKNGRIKSRISSFYYMNYNQMKDNLTIRYAGELNTNPFSQLFYLLGMRIKS